MIKFKKKMINKKWIWKKKKMMKIITKIKIF